MRLSLKVALVLCLFTLGLSFSGSLAQTADISSVTSPTSVNLNSVCIVNNVTSVGNDLTMLNAWAVGDSGAIAQWDGNSWSTVPSPSEARQAKELCYTTMALGVNGQKLALADSPIQPIW